MKKLPHSDLPTVITVFLALGGLGMMLIFSGLIGFGFHSVIGKISLYICFGLQAVNVLVMLLRRHTLRSKFNAPEPSKKMRRFTLICLLIWLLGIALLVFSLIAYLLWFAATHSAVMYTCVIGACIAPVGWLGLLAAFHRSRESVIHAHTQKEGVPG